MKNEEQMLQLYARKCEECGQLKRIILNAASDLKLDKGYIPQAVAGNFERALEEIKKEYGE